MGGVTIDLRRMNAVELATNGSFARVGGGAVTADVYSALDARNMSFVGGRVGSVGVGGFATGGGTSPLASRHGWAVNSIYEYEVRYLHVLANFALLIRAGCLVEHYRRDNKRVSTSIPLLGSPRRRWWKFRRHNIFRRTNVPPRTNIFGIAHLERDLHGTGDR